MLAIFKNGLAEAPKELHSPAASSSSCVEEGMTVKKPKPANETLNDFLASHSHHHPNHHHHHHAFSLAFGDNACLAFAPPHTPSSSLHHHRLFCGVDDIYCIFMGRLSNLFALNKQYGLSKGANEAMFAIEAYRTLRDRGPYPAHQVLRDLDGSFGFVIYDAKAKTVFVALGADEGVKLFWGIGADGSIVISDSLEVIKGSCGKSFAPFPNGCMYNNERGGLMSYEHPMNKMKAMPRIDSEGAMCGAYFKVDTYSKINSNSNSNSNSMPRVGSGANWAAAWGPQA